MLFSAVQVDDALKEAFEQFKQDPLNTFRVNVRRTRAAQLRQLLSNSAAIDVATFQREVWNIETGTYLRSRNISFSIFGQSSLIQSSIEQLLQQGQVTLTELEVALTSGDLELHGNYIWRQGAHIFAPHSKDDQNKLNNIRSALQILNDTDLSSLQKAKQLKAIDGFGDNNATGLVMIFHPNDFALINSVSRGILNTFGFNVNANTPLIEMQQELTFLKDSLDAEDFLELDWFLYLYILGRHMPEDNTKNDTVKPLLWYSEPPFENIHQEIIDQGMRMDKRTIRRYHLSLKSRGFVILSGPSGTGKTWLTKAYADAVQARYLLIPVAPNWTTNEDLLGYVDPLNSKLYRHTPFSSFLESAAQEYSLATSEGRTPHPYHLVLDEMNLARVEYYFATFLSAMETRAREDEAVIPLGVGKEINLYPNLFFIGTINVDETTHGFADKVYDRAQLIEMTISRDALKEYMKDAPYSELLLSIWDTMQHVAPFAFRVLTDVDVYVRACAELGISWQDAIDEQILQKILPKCKGIDSKVGETLERLTALLSQDKFPLSNKKLQYMIEGYQQHGIASYF